MSDIAKLALEVEYQDANMALCPEGEPQTIDCEVCNGDGEHSQPHPFPDDPYYEIVTPCPNCKGTGQVEIDEPLPPHVNFCTSCKRLFRDGDTCPRGGCPMGGDF
jgi:DnaJ-class molecular chaperone